MGFTGTKGQKGIIVSLKIFNIGAIVAVAVARENKTIKQRRLLHDLVVTYSNSRFSHITSESRD